MSSDFISEASFIGPRYFYLCKNVKMKKIKRAIHQDERSLR